MAGAFRFELKTTILETGILPIKLSACLNLRWRIWHLSVRKRIRFIIDKSEIPNPPSEIEVSDGNRTRSFRFGRPVLSLLSFAHIVVRDENIRIHLQSEIRNPKSEIKMHRERFELSQRKPRQFYRLPALADRRPMRVFVENLCKNEKGRDVGTLRAQKCAR